MIFRFLTFTLTLSTLLLAGPTMAEVKQAVSQNPALLETPQAKALMSEKGVSLSEVQQELSKTTQKTSDNTKIAEIQNEIDTSDSDASTEMDDIKKIANTKSSTNPFTFQSNSKIKASLNAKKQTPKKTKLYRYSKRFYTNSNKVDTASLPTPSNYIMSTGDEIYIHIYGDRSKTFILNIQNNGTVDLAYMGPVRIGGMKYKDAVHFLESQLKKHFKNSNFNISINKYSTIQVTLIGDVKHPGIYNLSSFSTPKDLLIVAKGVSGNASVRDIIIKRNGKKLVSLDFYDLLFKAKNSNSILLKQGDIVVIQKAKKLVSIDGYVNNSAIFELSKDEKLSKLIEYAGGMKADASKLNIKIDRYSNNFKFETFKLSYKEAGSFRMKNGDKVYIYPLDFTAKNSVNISGNIIRPGSYSLTPKATLNELLKNSLKDGLKSFFLPETYLEYAVIQRYSDTLEYKTISFNISDIINNTKILHIKANDEIYVFSKNDIFSNSFVTTKGATLLNTGKLEFIDGMTILDSINASQINGLLADKVKVTTYNTKDFMPKTTFYSLKTQADTKLNPYDEVEVYDYYSRHILEPVYISGEVVNPTSVYFEKGMSLAQLVRSAGGLTKKAYTKNIEIVRYYLDENLTRERRIVKIDIENAKFDDITLEPYDEVRIFKIPKWGERKTITLKGQVRFPGTYTIETGEKLHSVIKRAGGFTDEAFIRAAVFTRQSVRNNQINQYNRSLAQIKRQLAIFNAMPANAKKSADMGQANNTLNEVMLEAKKYQPIGRISIKLDRDLTALQESPYNMVIHDKDTLVVPSKIDTVTVFGEVFNPTSFVYDEDLDLSDYINMASGITRGADSSNIYVIHADGTSEPFNAGWFFASSDNIKAGDTIVVPIYIKEHDNLDVWDSIAKILASFALTVAAVNSLGVI